LQQEVVSACPFCGSSDVDLFEIHYIDDDPNKSATPSSQVNKFYGPIETAIVGDTNIFVLKEKGRPKQQTAREEVVYNLDG